MLKHTLIEYGNLIQTGRFYMKKDNLIFHIFYLTFFSHTKIENFNSLILLNIFVFIYSKIYYFTFNILHISHGIYEKRKIEPCHEKIRQCADQQSFWQQSSSDACLN